MITLRIESESWPYKVPFRVSRGAEAALPVIVVTLTDSEGRVGRGEAAGVDYDGETIEGLRAQIEALRPAIESALDADLVAQLPAGGARNALDCAWWDLTAKRRGVSAFALAGFDAPREITTATTLGIDTDEAVAAGARRYQDWPLIKVKVDARRHIEVVRLVRGLCTGRIIVDPNQSWSLELLNRLAPELESLGVALIEQPVARGTDDSLRSYTGRIPLAADESVSDRGSLARIQDLYQFINVKLDKSGGLTEALALARAARALDLGVMVGCMAGTSLAMAPGMVVGQLAGFVDLDGPLLHAHDREPGIIYQRGRMGLPPPALWG
ncbi:MAG: dipeptide epimerase [Steroidobacteraceae bacterium]|jgi:L-alanine-DL-glutamate epimerase-like enolase superfamily enzyme